MKAAVGLALAVTAAAVVGVVAVRDEAGPERPAAVVVPGLGPCPPALAVDMPQGSLPCFDGGPDVRLSGAPGRPVLVNLWATWCTPCVEEVPALVEFAERAGDRVGVVGVVHQDSPTSVAEFARVHRITYPLVRDDGGVVLREHGAAPPRTLLVAADGRIAHTQVGAFDDAADIADAVARHLGVRV